MQSEVVIVMRYTDGGVGWAGWILMVLMMLAFWGAIAWVAVTLIRHSGSRTQIPQPDAPAQRGPDSLRILEERFARGEIDEDEFRRRRDVLRDST
jgi:putative membrane protein